MVEYLVIAIVFVAVFFMSFDDNPPLVVMFIDAVKTAFDNFSSAVSVP